MSLKAQLIKPAMDVLYYTGTYHLFKPAFAGVGAIFMLHHVRPAGPRGDFSPNRVLEVTPEFLDETIQWVMMQGYEIVSLDEAQRRLLERDFRRRFVCFTLDDGYVDNYLHALPVFQKYNAPFTIYIHTGLPDGNALLWWWMLEDIVRDNNRVGLRLNGDEVHFITETLHQKQQAYERIYWVLRLMPSAPQRTTVQNLLDRYHIDPSVVRQRLAISWEMVSELASNELATIGAHTLSHPALSRLSTEEARDEIAQSRDIIEKRIGRPVRHFAYPYGDPKSAGTREFRIIRDLGFTTATTTRKGVLFPEHANHLDALPRVPINGDAYQHLRYVELYLSGAPSALWGGFRRLDVN